ncbi:hypothetical protein WUBG_18891 [Wuchereria bancrofti]|uniref:SSD domain-containing protein n=1 Tax=Wuchereria bancrofti TaxID=6293 RepID=J9DKR3_WUCBA|nr:hypothetical protein WUBG_18891 [Wuchereria bancrofti]
MTTDAWQSALGILLCMAFISFIFLYDIFTVAVVSVAIVSIMTGIVGILTLMGLNLEPIMMAAMLISMGFSVDIPAHVAYHYNSNGKTLLWYYDSFTLSHKMLHDSAQDGLWLRQ